MCITGDYGTPFVNSSVLSYNICLNTIETILSFYSKFQTNLNCAGVLVLKYCSNIPLKLNVILKHRILIILLIFLWILPRQTLCIMDGPDKHQSINFQNQNFYLNKHKNSSMYYKLTNKLNTKVKLNRLKRSYLLDHRKLKFLNSEIIDFVCNRLPDPCSRAAYLRQHVRHSMCYHLPLLYILPYIDENILTFKKYRMSTCKGGLSRLTYLESDGLFKKFLASSSVCEKSLLDLKKIMDTKLMQYFNTFNRLLHNSFCIKEFDKKPNITGEFKCEECRVSLTF